jgi:hypothetical protein
MRRKCLLVMVVLGLLLWVAALSADAQEPAPRYSPGEPILQAKLSDQQLAQAVGHGYEKLTPCQDGKIILWDEWNRPKPTATNNAGNQGQVIICGSHR